MICGARGIPMPHPNPVDVLRSSGHAGFFARLSDELLADVHGAYLENCDRANRIDCYLLDAVRAEYARRHRPVVLA